MGGLLYSSFEGEVWGTTLSLNGTGLRPILSPGMGRNEEGQVNTE